MDAWIGFSDCTRPETYQRGYFLLGVVGALTGVVVCSSHRRTVFVLPVPKKGRIFDPTGPQGLSKTGRKTIIPATLSTT